MALAVEGREGRAAERAAAEFILVGDVRGGGDDDGRGGAAEEPLHTIDFVDGVQCFSALSTSMMASAVTASTDCRLGCGEAEDIARRVESIEFT